MHSADRQRNRYAAIIPDPFPFSASQRAPPVSKTARDQTQRTGTGEHQPRARMNMGNWLSMVYQAPLCARQENGIMSNIPF